MNVLIPIKPSVCLLLILLTACGSEHHGSPQSNANVVTGCSAVIRDIDGNQYSTVAIGSQCWLAENLATTRYRDGTAIEGTGEIDKEKYGLLYLFSHVVHPAGLCPQGWHVPTEQDFQQFEALIGLTNRQIQQSGWRGDNNPSRRLKLFDRDLWWTASQRAHVNAYGFGLLPSGALMPNGNTAGENWFVDLWSSTSHNEEKAWYRSVGWLSTWSVLRGSTKQIKRKAVDKTWGFSVRCISETS